MRANKLLAEELRSASFGSIGSSYSSVGDAFTHPPVIIEFFNNTDETLLFSLDGSTDHIVVESNGHRQYKYGDQGILSLGNLLQVYVKEESMAPTDGTAYVTAFYLKEV